jgi:hypothetical protein
MPTSSCVAEAGSYVVKLSASSKDSRLKGMFKLNKYLTVEKKSIALAPPEKIKELKPAK